MAGGFFSASVCALVRGRRGNSFVGNWNGGRRTYVLLIDYYHRVSGSICLWRVSDAFATGCRVVEAALDAIEYRLGEGARTGAIFSEPGMERNFARGSRRTQL